MLGRQLGESKTFVVIGIGNVVVEVVLVVVVVVVAIVVVVVVDVFSCIIKNTYIHITNNIVKNAMRPTLLLGHLIVCATAFRFF
jgi:hypothetical protein